MKEYKQFPPVGVGERLRKAMIKEKVSASALAKKAGVGRTSIYDYLNGERPMTTTTCVRICGALRISTDWLLLGR